MAKLDAVQPVLMVRDVAASIRFYQRLGFQLAFADSQARSPSMRECDATA